MRHSIMIVAAALLLVSAGLFAQPHQGRPGMAGRPERIEKFRMMRLVELLKLNEEDAVRFYAKQNAHEEKIAAILPELDEMIGGGLITLERAKVIVYRFHEPA